MLSLASRVEVSIDLFCKDSSSRGGGILRFLPASPTICMARKIYECGMLSKGLGEGAMACLVAHILCDNIGFEWLKYRLIRAYLHFSAEEGFKYMSLDGTTDFFLSWTVPGKDSRVNISHFLCVPFSMDWDWKKFSVHLVKGISGG